MEERTRLLVGPAVGLYFVLVMPLNPVGAATEMMVSGVSEEADMPARHLGYSLMILAVAEGGEGPAEPVL